MIKRSLNRGQAMVELAFMLPVFIVLILGIVDFGRAFHCYSVLNSQCVSASREASKRNMQLIARGVYTSTTHVVDVSTSNRPIFDAFWRHKSPIMSQADFTPGEPNGYKIVGVGTNAEKVTVTATFNMNLYTPLVGSLIGSANGDGKLTITAEAKDVQKE